MYLSYSLCILYVLYSSCVLYAFWILCMLCFYSYYAYCIHYICYARSMYHLYYAYCIYHIYWCIFYISFTIIILWTTCHIIYDIIYQLFSISYYINHKNDRPPQPRSDPCHLSKLATRISRCHPQACVCQIFFNGQEVFVAASKVVPTKSPSHWLSFGLSPSQDASHKWRFILGFPPKNGIILVVTVTGRGDNPSYHQFLNEIQVRNKWNIPWIYPASRNSGKSSDSIGIP